MKYKTWWVILGFTLIVGLIIFSCSAPEEPTYGSKHPDPNPAGKSAAVIDSIVPNHGLLKQIVTIFGKNFEVEPTSNFVTFEKKVAKVLTATTNELTIELPIFINDTISLRVGVKGSEYWSNEIYFVFDDLVPEVIDSTTNWPMGVEADDDGNVYVGSATDSAIYKIAPDGSKSVFASLPIKGSIGWGPGNYLYVCEQGEEKIERISPDGSTIEEVVSVPGPVDFDWDQNGNMYIVENETGIHRLDPSGTLTYMVDLSTAKCCRVFGNYLYVTAIWDGKISRFEITASGLGDEEVILEEIDSPVGIEFDVNGTMYYTLAEETSLFTLAPDGSEEVLYEGELTDPAESPMHYLTFYKKNLFIVHPGWADVGLTVSAYIGVEQAPNYGRP
jgi:DNA-binding beta-propeller fold protein YncE